MLIVVSDNVYENLRRVSYDCGEHGMAVFVPVCRICGRYVKANMTILSNELVGLRDEPNAKCSKCGDIKMFFEGFF